MWQKVVLDRYGRLLAGYKSHLAPGNTCAPVAQARSEQPSSRQHVFYRRACLDGTVVWHQHLPRARQNLEEWERLKPSFNYYDIDRQHAEQAAKLQVALRRQGWQLETVDALIATVALQNGLILLTTDNDFSPISELQQENWLQP
jgi:predicted nucleic acid-binding protein